MQCKILFRLLAVASLIGMMSLPQALATHNRAGEISIEQIDCSLTVKATVVTYTKASSRPADRDSLTICWGQGLPCQRVPRINGPGTPGQGELLENDTKKNIYCAFFTFSSPGTYTISMTDPNRNGGILNVNPPNSDQIRFHLQTTYTIPNPQFQGCNSTPVLRVPPIYEGCVGQPFTYNPGASDPDGDSLSYHLTVPLQDLNIQVPFYQFPNQINPGPNNMLSLDAVTGDLRWSSPQLRGEYNIAFYIVSWRNGFPLDTVLRDMQILIRECDNVPPVVTVSEEEICVVAGELVQIEVIATAPIFETTQRVRLVAFGEPMEHPVSPAAFLPNDNTFQNDPVVKTFQWQTTCEHISNQFYSVVFAATDNFFGDTLGLATLKSIRIKVVGPPPEDVAVESAIGQIKVTWQAPYSCEDAQDEYFQGFTVWRRLGSNAFEVDECTPGLSGRGYTRLNITPISNTVNGRYEFNDPNVERGRTYCYRVLAQFARNVPNSTLVYNIVESLPSEEVCIQLSRDLPLLTKVDVESTDAQFGEIGVCWSKPRAGDLDTLMNPGPYTYEVLRAPGINPAEGEFQPIGVSFTSQWFATANDTCFTDAGLNTLGSPYSYKVSFYVNGESQPLGASSPASSVFLSAAPTDRANLLSWEERVPWTNSEYVVSRQNGAGVFEPIATVAVPSYRDEGLVNGSNYCYKIQSIGSYGVEDLPEPLLNHSQELCSTPIDNVPPCPPMLTVQSICDLNVNCADIADLSNQLEWTNPADFCDDSDDVDAYRVYYAPAKGADFQLIASIESPSLTSFSHLPQMGIAGCYYVTALDTVRNESLPSDTICVDNCPFYELPNTFTPNDDGQNDIFKPYPFCFIASVNFTVFNRWGELVFETTDPALNWNGNNLRGERLTSGVYYYTCNVFEQRVDGVVPSPDILSGYIQLIR